MKPVALGAMFLLGVLASGCADPIRSDALVNLGDEDSNVPPGPLHRPGQPCAGACHDGKGPGAWIFSMAGTVYQYADDPAPVPGAIINIVDSASHVYKTETNCAGNFFVQQADFAPVYPAWVSVTYRGVSVPMSSPIFREGACAGCHAIPASQSSAGQVFFALQHGYAFEKGSCP